MKVVIYGAVVKKGHNKVMKPDGFKQYMPTREEYHDNEILKLAKSGVGVYGRHWVYAGDQGFQESNIHVTVEYDDGAKETKIFGGRKALNEMVKYLDDKGLGKDVNTG